MSTKHIYVRHDWTELTDQIANEKAVLSRVAVGGPAIAFLAALLLRGLPLPLVAGAILSHATFFCLLYAIAVWYALRHHPGATGVALGVYLGSLGISVMASYLALGDSVGTLRSGTGLRWTSIAGSALLMLNWLLVRTVAGEHRPAFKAIGLAMPASKWHLAFGVVSGCLFAAHFFFTGLLADLFAPAWRALPAILWEISVVAGLRSLSEELFFRGLVFNQLYRLRRGGFWAASAVATVCNILPYIVLGWHSDPTFFTLTLFYVAALSMVNAFLYRMSHSIVPGVLNSVLFYSLTSFNLPGG